MFDEIELEGEEINTGGFGMVRKVANEVYCTRGGERHRVRAMNRNYVVITPGYVLGGWPCLGLGPDRYYAMSIDTLKLEVVKKRCLTE